MDAVILAELRGNHLSHTQLLIILERQILPSYFDQNAHLLHKMCTG